LTVRGDNTRARAGTTPAGAAGPHSAEQELQGWLSGFNTRFDKSAADGFGAYDGSTRGFLIGVDLSVAENILVGVAGGSGSSSMDKENGASSDARTTYGAVYASVGTKDWFADTSLIFGGSSIDNTLGSVFNTTSEYDAQNMAFYVGGGKEIIGKYLIVTPQASLLANYYKQDAYDEKSTDAVARSVDSFDALYAQSSLGCSLGFYTAMGNMTLKPELRAHWLHEFNASEESLPYSLLGGTGNYTMLLQAPEEDILKIGAGLVAKMSEYLELRADLDTRWGSDYSDYTLLGSIRYQF
jgi:outer membrane autotransporter protein